MAVAKKGLGRGLSALIPDDIEFLSRIARGDDVLDAPVAPRRRASARAPRGADDSSEQHLTEVEAEPLDASAVPGAPDRVVEWVPLSAIEANPFQPRRTFNDVEMQELVESVREHGVLQPILVRPLRGSGPIRFQLVAGERRWRAATAAGLEQVPAVVRDVADQQALELALIENVQRHDISAVDAAIAYQRLATEFHLSQEDIARRVGKSRSSIANTVRLLDLPVEARTAIDNGEISEGHGRAILLAPTEGARRAVFREVLRGRLSVRDAEHLARKTGESSGSAKENGSTAGSVDAAALTAELKDVEFQLQKALGTRVKVRPKGPKSKSGQIVVEFFSDDDLYRLSNLIRGRKTD